MYHTDDYDLCCELSINTHSWNKSQSGQDLWMRFTKSPLSLHKTKQILIGGGWCLREMKSESQRQQTRERDRDRLFKF